MKEGRERRSDYTGFNKKMGGEMAACRVKGRGAMRGSDIYRWAAPPRLRASPVPGGYGSKVMHVTDIVSPVSITLPSASTKMLDRLKPS